jgi:hypothetical protein
MLVVSTTVPSSFCVGIVVRRREHQHVVAARGEANLVAIDVRGVDIHELALLGLDARGDRRRQLQLIALPRRRRIEDRVRLRIVGAGGK